MMFWPSLPCLCVACITYMVIVSVFMNLTMKAAATSPSACIGEANSRSRPWISSDEHQDFIYNSRTIHFMRKTILNRFAVFLLVLPTGALTACGNSGTPPTTTIAAVGTTSDTPAVHKSPAVSAGTSYSCALLSSGGVKCWGKNVHGALGDDTTDDRSTPTDVLGVTEVTAISSGAAHTCAVLSAGSVKCWGWNEFGQLGDGTRENRLKPVEVPGLAGVVAISNGWNHTCALLSTGGVKCWGSIGVDDLTGSGTTEDSLKPTDVPGLADVIAVSSGAAHTCAVLSSGRVKCWGENSSGELGDGTTEDSFKPTDAGGLTDVIAVSANGSHTCALLSSGDVKCWGSNGSGELGDGTIDDRLNPTDVVGLTGVLAISSGSGGSNTCAVLASGNVKCWGFNAGGQIGDGTTDDRLTPTDVSGLTGVVAIATGWSHACAALSSGAVKCWGANVFGQLGDGTTEWGLTSVDVVELNLLS